MSVYADFSGGRIATASQPLWQYDYGQVVEFKNTGLPDGAVPVHFEKKYDASAIVTTGTCSGGTVTATIPDQLLAVATDWNYDILGYIFPSTSTSGTTAFTAIFKVAHRSQAGSETPTPAQQSAWDQAIASLQDYETAINGQVGDLSGRLETLEREFAGFTVHIDASMLEDGSLPRSKVDAAFEETLVKADSAMQPSVYDPNGYGARAVDPYSYALARANEVGARLETTNTEIRGAYAVYSDENDRTDYPNLGAAVRGAYTKAMQYANAVLADYEPIDIRIVDALPQAGNDRTFYLIPKETGNGYDKYWFITDENGQKVWDVFGASSTVVVNVLPSTGEADVDYILSSDGIYQYYKWIDGSWQLIAGGTAVAVVSTTPIAEVGNGAPTGIDPEDYISEGVASAYLDAASVSTYIPVDNGAGYSWGSPQALVASPNTTKDYYVYYDAKGSYLHFRYDGSAFRQVGNDTYSKAEVDVELAALTTAMASLRSTLSGEINTIDAKVDALGNMVSDLTETAAGVRVHYKDGSTKDVQTKDTTVKVEDADALENNSGIRIVYTDGSTKDIEIAGGGGGGASSGSASITRVTDAAVQCVYGGSCPIQYTFQAMDASGDIVGSGAATWYVNNVKKATSTALQGVTNTFDIGPYLSVGSNTVRLSVSVDTGGETNTVRTKSWTVNAINMYLVWDYDDTTLNSSETVTIRWTPYGDISKTTHFIIDGVEDQSLATVTTRSGVQQFVTFNRLSHGSHTVELYLDATVNNTRIESAHIMHDMMFIDTASAVPVISCSLPANQMTQYNTMLIPFAVYDPSGLTASVTLAENGTTVATRTVDRALYYWSYTPATYGTKTLTITCGQTVKTLTITVDELDIDNEEVGGYAFRLKASDLAGNDALRAWSSNGVGLTFSSNFDWNNGGLQTSMDSAGAVTQYICVKAGTTMTIGYNLFGNDAKVNGKSIKVIFRTANCRDYDAQWFDCMSGNIGIALGANSGTVKSEQNTLETQYAEGRYVEFETDVYPDSMASSAGNPMRYIETYIDGVLSAMKIYAANDNFTQQSPKGIIIGSPDCDVYIYMVKCYESYLTAENHLSNFIADAANASEMVQRYNRNNILNQAGEIDYNLLAAANPNCRVHLLEIPRMTLNKIKKDPVAGCSYQQIYAAGDEGDQLTAEGITIGVQGTSSINYILSAANLDLRFDDGFTDGNGQHTAGYAMSDGSVPTSFFNLKVNVASCENINNMCIAEWYDQHQPYVTRARANVEGGRDCMEHHIGVVFIRDRHEDNEQAEYALFPDVDPNGDNFHMYAVCNMGNSKNNGEVFHDATNPLECCLETKDNNSAICMMTTQLTEEALDSEDYFEFRYPSKPTQAMKDAFISFVNWAASRNPAAATGNALAEPVTYEAYTFKGTSAWDTVEQPNEVLAGLTISDYAGTYTHDTYEYRMARLLAECEDHLVMDSIVYHYVFVEQHAMVDNVCKNTFWGTDDLVHWHLCKNYDNDTADGNNNTGKLTIPFGAEGMDTISGGDVFNGKMNVYWQFVYGLYPARRRMWQNREAVGTWNADAYLEFATGQQNYLPERVYNRDYWYKYLRPYEQNADTQYITMLEGGKKTHQREAFVRNNLTYMASQYMGTYCTSDSITVRAYTPGISSDMTPEQAAIIARTIEVVPPNPVIQVMLYNKGYVVVEVASVMKRVKAEKGVWYSIDFSESSSAMNDTVVNIHGAGNVRAIGDMSSLYIRYCNFSRAAKLRNLQIGSALEGYSNQGLTSVGFESNPMLEELYIQNCPNAATTLDLSGCQALRTLDVRGSGFTGIIFATGGLLDDAKLCSPSALTMRNLYYIEDTNFSLESYGNLTTLRFEDTPGVSSLAIITAAANLNRARILGIDWELADTTLLNRMLTLLGLDESDHNTDMSVLAGEVSIAGAVRQRELEAYADAWQDLDVTYDPSMMVVQYLATYVNADGSTLYTTYVDRGSTPPDPVALGLISTPVQASTEQYIFTYTGWDDIESAMLTARTITAQYSSTVRTYTVRWYSRIGVLLETQQKLYGEEAVFSGDTPVNNSEEATYIYNVFAGWDKSTGFVTGDLDVYAVWARASLPVAGTELEDMSIAEIFAVCTAGRAGDYFVEKDHFDIQMGNDFTFSNVEERTILENRWFDGVDDYFDTNIKLFDEDSPSFTLAIDYEFLSSNTSNDTLVSCYDESGSEGFRLRYSSSSPNIQWGDRNVAVGNGANRNMVVLRHVKGSRTLWVYAFNLGSDTYDLEITRTELVRTRDTSSDTPLTFGAVRYSGSGGHDYYTKGWIHWCKIWYADLGDNIARQIAAWPRETLSFDFAGANVFRLAGQTNEKANGFFVSRGLLSLYRRVNATNTNAGGWAESEMRQMMMDRAFNGLPLVLRSCIKTVRVPSSIGNRSTEIVYSEDKLFLPSVIEVEPSVTDQPYIEEGSNIPFYTGNRSRVKFCGVIIRDDANVISSASDPTALSSVTVQEGDVWNNTGSSNSVYYVYISEETVNQHSKIGNISITSSSNIQAEDGGLWVRADYWWLRSPTGNNTAGFMRVRYTGLIETYGTVNAFAICICFTM